MMRVRLHESPKRSRKMRDGICANIGITDLRHNITPASVNAARTLYHEHRLKQPLLKATTNRILKLLSNDVTECAHRGLATQAEPRGNCDVANPNGLG
ncbi:MAG: hypothetical protein WCH99_14425 [Verrucomicrobiota bacterium]